MPTFRSQLSKLFNIRSWIDNPTVPLTAIAAWNDLSGGPTAAGELITERTAMSVSTVYTCVTLLSESVASLPCRLMRRMNGGKADAFDSPLYNLLASQPNPDMTAFTFWSTMVGCAALTGNGYAQIITDKYGEPESIWPLHPLKTEPVRMPDGDLAFRTTDGMKNGGYRIIPSEEVLHFPLFSLDGIKGVSPVTAARESFALAKAAEKFGARWFGNGAHVPSVFIHNGPRPDGKTQREIAESWQEAHGGANANKQGFLFGDWDIKTLGLSPEDSQFLATRTFQRADIAAMFHIAPSMVGDTTRQSNSNHVQVQLSFVTDTLRPIIIRIEQEIQRKLLNKRGKDEGKLFVTFDTSARLRGDFQSQMQGYAIGRQWGFLCVNDIRADLGMNNIGPEGDTFLYPVNMADASQLLKDGSMMPNTQVPLGLPASDADGPEPESTPPPKKKKKA